MKIYLIIIYIFVFGLLEANCQEVKFDKRLYREHLQFLANDLFEGRGIGSRGAELAAKYLASEFSEIGLSPIGHNGTFYQHIPMHSTKTLPNTELKIFEENTFHELEYEKDFLIYKTGEQAYLPNYIELVFAGYGIIAPEYDYNDYLSIDVGGKIVVLLEGEPSSDDPDYFKGVQPTVHSHIQSKHIIATSRGAIGCMIVPRLIESKYSNWDKIKNDFLFDDVTLAYSLTTNLCLIINQEKAGLLFNNSEMTLEEVYYAAMDNKIYSFPLSTKLTFKGSFKRKDFISANISGIIYGSDPNLKSSYVLVSAHYDHLGIGPAINGDSIYNGLTDNAMGVASLIEIARAISNMPISPKRSIVFLLTTGEEKGLLGSTYYTDNPLIPLYRTVANVNIDGIAFIDNFNSLVAVGAEYSTIAHFLLPILSENSCYLSQIPGNFIQSESFYFSDQYAFARAGIPSILIADGPDYVNLSSEESIEKLINYAGNIYHTPFDDLNLQIDLNAAIKHTRITHQFILNLANSIDIPKWRPDAPFLIEQLRTAAEKR